MRHLAQPAVVRSAMLAALGTALACYPRLVWWQTRQLPVWYLELILLFGSFFLWSFVFGWQRPYGGNDPLQPPSSPRLWSLATLCAIAVGALHFWLIDPVLRAAAPEEFPANLGAWIAMALFSLGLTQLFVIFAPLAFFLRVISRGWPAFVLTLAFNIFVMLLKASSSTPLLPSMLLAGLVLVRLLNVSLLLYFYSRGGLPLAGWMILLVQSRCLFELLP